ncbi:ESPR-type extended signal peptide-containing protein [uncultured Dialister sp.]|uniref:ESPR-type extended signal peptide-containing protein n=1 Tax=uncultured Dialister sp. TaxID=278064 RepID=UPI00266EB766|nr:ESPR-type extended signal peptide-containing protein [uncultured Dialister sp.]
MNRVYKVIWSKAKHCYVVTSEIAKGYGKSAGSKGVKALLSGLVALSIAMGGYGMAGAVFVDSKDTPTTPYETEVYTKLETNTELAKKADATALDGKADRATTLAGYGITNAYTKAAVNKKIAAEAAARKQADQGNLKIGDDGVVSVVKGDSNQDVNKLVLKVDGDNQITMDEKGIKVGTNSIVIGSDGTIKGANERFSVGPDGKVTAAYGKIGTVEITSAGAVSGVTDLTVSGDVEAVGNLTVGNGNFTVNGITGNVTTGYATIGDDLTVKRDTEIGGDLGVNGNIKTNRGFIQTGGGNINTQGGALRTNGGNINAGDGLIQTTGTVKAGKVKTGTLKTTGKATIGGALTVKGDTKMKGNLSVKGEFKSKTLSSELDKNNYTTINGGKTQSVNLKVDAVGTETQASASTFDENGSNAWAKDDDSIGKSSMTADKISQSLSDKGDNPKNAASRVLSQIADNKYEIADSVVDANGNTNTSTQLSDRTITNIKNGTNESIDLQEVDQIGSSVTDGTNTTMVSQNAGSLISSITDKANNTSTGVTQTATDITNTANNGTIANEAKDITNKAEEKLSNSAAEIENSASKSITDKVGENTSWKMTDGKISESIDNGTASNKENTTVDGTKRIITNGEGTGTYNQTATSNNISLKNAAGDTYFTKSESLDGEKTSVKNPNGSSTINQSAESIVNFVKNSEGTTKTEQSAVDIKNTAKNGTITNNAMDVLNKGANSVINKVGDNKVAVKTDSVKAAYGSDTYTTWNGKGITSNTSGNMRNSATNITNKAEEKLSNSAAEIENSASKSITDKVGENTSWKMTDGKISESIDNGTASNKENTTVDGTKRIITNGEGTGTYNQTATSNNISLKNAAGDTYFTKSESLDGEKTSVKNPNGSSTINQSAESIVNFVKNSEGTTKTEQSAVDIKNTAKNGTITNNAMDVLNKGANSVINKVGDNKVAVKTDSVKAAYGSDTYTTWNGKGITSNTSGNMRNTVGGKMLNNVTGDMENKVGGDLINTVTGDSSLSATNIKNKASTSITSQIGEDGKVKSEMTADGITNTAKDGTIYNKSKDILNEASGDIINWADGEIGNVATKITNITGDNTVTSDTNGTTFENKEHSTAVKEGTVTKTTISGNTIETGQATMDYADVTKDLSVGGNATVENDLTVKGASEFVGRADFRYDVFMDENLTVAKETRTDTLYVDHDGYVGGNLNVEGNIETHDAVLSADSRQVVTGRQLYQTNERVDRLDNRIKKVGANAAALAALRPGDFNPDDKFSIAAGFGSYRNANAAALGLFYRPNENVLLSLGTSFGDGENMVNAGVSVKFGRGKSMAERRKEMADEVSSMRDEMRSQDERIAELEEMLKKQSELIEKLSKES